MKTNTHEIDIAAELSRDYFDGLDVRYEHSEGAMSFGNWDYNRAYYRVFADGVSRDYISLARAARSFVLERCPELTDVVITVAYPIPRNLR